MIEEETTVERHMTLTFENGTTAVANFVGPGTHLYRKVRENIQPLSEVDRAARAHDIRYALADNDTDIKIADEKMMSTLWRIYKNKTDTVSNVLKTAILLKCKMLADKLAAKVETGKPIEAVMVEVGGLITGSEIPKLASALKQFQADIESGVTGDLAIQQLGASILETVIESPLNPWGYIYKKYFQAKTGAQLLTGDLYMAWSRSLHEGEPPADIKPKLQQLLKTEEEQGY